ncbi:MAG: MGDG synthase family glycosyltransferase [Jatrophihabitans sp.]
MPRVLIVTAAMGAGHTRVASELARRLDEEGAEAEVVDVLALAGRAGRRLQRAYRLLLSYAPWLYDAAMRYWARYPGPLERLVAGRSGAAERVLRAAVAEHRPDVVVSTYNLAAQALGRLAAHGEVSTPLVTLVTDPGAHPYWVSRSATLHIAALPQTAARLEAFGAMRTAVAPPVLRPQLRTVPTPHAARQLLGLPTGRIALVTAGSWAAGRVRRTVTALAALPDVFVVVVCGTDARLCATLTGRPGVRAFGWTEQLPAYLAAVDVVVDNAGGLTCWEALACGTPVVLFHPLPGHGRFNAATLAEAGLVRAARTRAELRAAVSAPATVPPLPWVGAPEAEAHILAVARNGPVSRNDSHARA